MMLIPSDAQSASLTPFCRGHTLATMTPSTYAPLEAQTSLSTGGPSDRYDDFVTESKHDTQANYSKISGRSSFSIPRKPLQSDDRPAQASPVPLSRPWYTTLMHTALDVFIFFAPLTFFTLAWCAYQLGGKEVSAWGISVQEWSLIVRAHFLLRADTDIKTGAYYLPYRFRGRDRPLDTLHGKFPA